MIQYSLECIAFQLVFLIIYDLFLKKETFFQWNRVYLLFTFVAALILPLITIAAFKTQLPQDAFYAEYLWNLQPEIAVVSTTTKPIATAFSFMEIAYGLGALLAAVLFGYKLYQLYVLRRQGEVRYLQAFTRVIIAESTVAFSFFKTIFLGDKITDKDQPKIIAHELVHIKQGHSYDLLLFEMLRILCWFNPLVYLYQHRISELHEFIVDAKVAKTHKKEQYQFLLSQVFDTQHISFINQFFNTSLIKKRIVMLQKSKSKKSLKLKYVFLIPILVGMLFYTSCEKEAPQSSEIEGTNAKSYIEEAAGADKVPFAVVDVVPVFPGCKGAADTKACFQEKMRAHIAKNFKYPQDAQDQGIQGRVSILFTIGKDGTIGNVRMRGPHPSLEKEAKRIIDKLPRMTPGEQNGKVVAVPFSIPITFNI